MSTALIQTLITGVPPAAAALPELALVCSRHGVSALVADLVQVSSPRLAELLRPDANATLSRGLKLRRLLRTVLDALATRGVTPTLLKGYGLASRLYAVPLARPASDVDILVSPDELGVVQDVLLGQHFEQFRDPGLHDVVGEHHHFAFVGPAGLVEVHFRLFFGFGGATFDDRAVLSRSVEAMLDGRPVRYLKPEDEFLYLSTHAANHSFLRVSWLIDLERFLRAYPRLDWSEMAELAHRAGVFEAVAATLMVLQGVLQVEIPRLASDAFRTSYWRGAINGWLFSPERLVSAAWAEHALASFAMRLWLVDTPTQAIRHIRDGGSRFVRRRYSKWAPP